MRFTLVTFATLSTSVLATQGFMSYDSLFPREASLSKRQGYYPPGPSGTCSGPGNTCQTACGSTYAECPLTGGRGPCYQPGSGSTCCIGTGKTCRSGYYCTRDKANTPYCCRQNVSAEECAKQNNVDGPLMPDPTGTPSAVPSPSNPPSPPSTPSTPSASPPSTPSSPPPPPPPTTPSTTPSAISSTTEKPPVVSTKPVLPSIPVLESSSTSKTLVSNVTSTSRTLPQFTGGAAVMRVAGQGAVMLAGAAGWVML